MKHPQQIDTAITRGEWLLYIAGVDIAVIASAIWPYWT
jgi:hypothetical protein